LKGKVGKTSIYDIKNIDNSLEIYKEVNLTMKKKGYIRKKELIEYTKNNYGIKVTNRMLNYYCKIGLLEPGIMERFDGVTGSVSYWKEETPQLLYVIKTLKSEGFKVKLKEMKYWLDLLNLNEKDVEEIRKMQEEDSEFNRDIMFSLGIKLKKAKYWVDLFNLSENDVEEIKKMQREDMEYNRDVLFSIGITPEQKKDLLNNVPLKLLDYEKLITRLDIFKRVAILRAYIELDQKEITKIYVDSGTVTKVQYGIPFTKSPIDDILYNPEIDINLGIPEIRVNYSDPVSKEVVFKKDGLIKVI